MKRVVPKIAHFVSFNFKNLFFLKTSLNEKKPGWGFLHLKKLRTKENKYMFFLSPSVKFLSRKLIAFKMKIKCKNLFICI